MLLRNAAELLAVDDSATSSALSARVLVATDEDEADVLEARARARRGTRVLDLRGCGWDKSSHDITFAGEGRASGGDKTIRLLLILLADLCPALYWCSTERAHVRTHACLYSCRFGVGCADRLGRRATGRVDGRRAPGRRPPGHRRAPLRPRMSQPQRHHHQMSVHRRHHGTAATEVALLAKIQTWKRMQSWSLMRKR
jgi:hypothetical protein